MEKLCQIMFFPPLLFDELKNEKSLDVFLALSV